MKEGIVKEERRGRQGMRQNVRGGGEKGGRKGRRREGLRWD